jgi:hypothetical protein
VKYQKEFMAQVRSRHFANSSLITGQLIPDTYQLYARVYEHGDVEAYVTLIVIIIVIIISVHHLFIIFSFCCFFFVYVHSAKVALLANMTESEQSRSDMCQLGLKCGLVIVLIFWNFALLLRPSHHLTPRMDTLAATVTAMLQCISVCYST